jgi:pyruvate dehydrogenase E2 component (dihydrolipoamide acetyltransferase)
VGDKISVGDVLCSIETDKATVDFEMQEEGYLAKTFFDAGTKDIPLGEVLAILAESPDDIQAFKDYSPAGGAAPAAPTPAAQPAAPAAPKQAAQPAAPVSQPAPSTPSSGRVFASPLAQSVASQHGINLAQVSGTGPNGRIIKADVEEALSRPQATATATQTQAPSLASAPSSGSFVDLPNSQIRKVIADRLTYSKQNIPHYYVTIQVSVDNLMKMRAKLNKVSSVKLSVNDFVMKAVAMSSLRVPATNSSWMGDFIRQYNNVNLSFAVQTDHGLMAPVLNNVNLKGLEQISNEVKDIANRARENKLKPDELSGGTFTVSNLGMYGVNNFSAIINPPQACILAVGGAVKTVVPNENAKEGEDPYRVAHLMNVTLSSDHRVVDGAVAA